MIICIYRDRADKTTHLPPSICLMRNGEVESQLRGAHMDMAQQNESLRPVAFISPISIRRDGRVSNKSIGVGVE